MAKFELGQVVQTRGIATACEEDQELNNSAVANNDDRIVAKYITSKGNIFIITEWDRSYTTIMFASEY